MTDKPYELQPGDLPPRILQGKKLSLPKRTQKVLDKAKTRMVSEVQVKESQYDPTDESTYLQYNLVRMKTDRHIQAEDAWLAPNRQLSEPIKPDDEVTFKGIKMPASMAMKWLEKVQEKASMVPISNEILKEREEGRKLRRANLYGLLVYEQKLEVKTHTAEMVKLFETVQELSDYEVAQNLKMHEHEIYEWKGVDPVEVHRNKQDYSENEAKARRMLMSSDEEIERWETVLGSTKSESMMDVIESIKPEIVLSGRFAAAGLANTASQYIGKYKAWLAGHTPDISYQDYKMFEQIRQSKLDIGLLVSKDLDAPEYAEDLSHLSDNESLSDEELKMLAEGNQEGTVRSMLGNFFQGGTDIMTKKGVQDTIGIMAEYTLSPTRDLTPQELAVIQRADLPYDQNFRDGTSLTITPVVSRSSGDPVKIEVEGTELTFAQQLAANREKAIASLAAKGRPVIYDEEEDDLVNQQVSQAKAFGYAGFTVGHTTQEEYFDIMAGYYINPDYTGNEYDTLRANIAKHLSEVVPDRFSQVHAANLEASAKLDQQMKQHVLWGAPVVRPQMQSYISAFPLPSELEEKFGVDVIVPTISRAGRQTQFYGGEDNVEASLLQINTLKYSPNKADQFQDEDDFTVSAQLIGMRQAAASAAQTFYRKGGNSYKESIQGKGMQKAWRQFGDNFDVTVEKLNLDTDEGIEHFISVLDEVMEAVDRQAHIDELNIDLDDDPTVRAVSGYVRDLINTYIPDLHIGYEPGRLSNSKSTLEELKDRLYAELPDEAEWEAPVLKVQTGPHRRYEDLKYALAYANDELKQYRKRPEGEKGSSGDDYEEVLIENIEYAKEHLNIFLESEGGNVLGIEDDIPLLKRMGATVPEWETEEEEEEPVVTGGDGDSGSGAAASPSDAGYNDTSLGNVVGATSVDNTTASIAPDPTRPAGSGTTVNPAKDVNRPASLTGAAPSVTEVATGGAAAPSAYQNLKTREEQDEYSRQLYYKQYPQMKRGAAQQSDQWFREKLTHMSSSVLKPVLGKRFDLTKFSQDRKMQSEIFDGKPKPFEGNIHTRRGNELEDKIAAAIEKANPGIRLVPMDSMSNSRNPLLGMTSIDRMAVSAETGEFLNYGYEIKAPQTIKQGEEGYEQVSDYIDQVQHQMATGAGFNKMVLARGAYGEGKSSGAMTVDETTMSKSATWQSKNIPIAMAAQAALNQEFGQGMGPFNTTGTFQPLNGQKVPYIYSEEFALAQKARDIATLKKTTLGQTTTTGGEKPKTKTQLAKEESAERGRLRRLQADERREKKEADRVAKEEAKAAEKEAYDNSIAGKLGNAKGAFLKKFAGPLAIAGLIKDGVDFIAEGAEGANNFIGKAYDMGMKPADMTEKIIGMSGQGMTLGQTHTVLGQTQLMAGGMEVGMFDGAKKLVIATRGALTFEDIQKYGDNPQKLMELLRQRTGGQVSERGLMAMLSGGGVDTSLLRVGDHGPEQSYLALTNSAKTFGNVSNAIGATAALTGGSAASMTEALESLNNFQEPKTEEQKAATREQQHAGRGGAPNRPHFGPSGNKGGAENVHVTVHLKQDGSTNLKAQRGNQNVEGKIGGRAQGMGITK